MRFPTRLSVRHLMLGVIVVAAACLALRIVLGFAHVYVHDAYFMGLTTGLLDPGQPVVLSDGYQAAPASQAIRATGLTKYKSTMYEWKSTPRGDFAIASGTSGVVEIDPAWDEDSCNEDRPIAVKLDSGPHQGVSVAIPRRLLRKQ